MTMPNMTAISRAAIDGSTCMSAHAFSGGGGYQGSSPSILSDPDAYRLRCDGPVPIGVSTGAVPRQAARTGITRPCEIASS